MRIILFDIDGTLVRTGGAGKTAIEAALCEEFGLPLVTEEVPYSGRTDPAICQDLLVGHGIEATAANLHRLREAYLIRLPKALGDFAGSICPGVNSLVDSLHEREDMLLGLLTGNVRRGARHKLTHYGLWDRFVTGGFGDDNFNRDEVARSAMRAVEEHFGNRINPADVWVIGDTPLDVSCARAIGANVAAVATGWHTIESLAESHPDILLQDLSDASALLAAWGSE